MSRTVDVQGIMHPARQIASPHCDARPEATAIELLVLHAISLPPEIFTGNAVTDFFTGKLAADEHPYFAQIAGLRVSAHFFIRRDGELIQFVPCLARAWHAGVSCWQKRTACNDFSIGIELEGSDTQPFTAAQYACLFDMIPALAKRYPLQAIVGHSDIAPGRKTDPGPFFDWHHLQHQMPEHLALAFPHVGQ